MYRNLDVNITLIEYQPAWLMKDWNSPVYRFFDLTPQIVKIDGHHAHNFKCQARNCKAKVRQYLDKGDACSTGNMQKHVHLCWGEEVLKAVDEAKDANEVRQRIVGSFLRNGSITASFEHRVKGKLHTCTSWTETSAFRAEIVCWVSESLRPFDIVKDRAFQSLMKTGGLEYYLPSPSTVLHDVQQVFVRTRQHVATMLQEYDGKINFTTDGWSLPNHCALVAFSAHFKHKGELLSIPLDIVEVGKVKKIHLYRYI
ncbi:hypothetical protein BDR03DRAFT_874951 [Suillus americanus]|nr:hypothetical protein BDR03DRAFT_874951 [Suillus americanus]